MQELIGGWAEKSHYPRSAVAASPVSDGSRRAVGRSVAGSLLIGSRLLYEYEDGRDFLESREMQCAVQVVWLIRL